MYSKNSKRCLRKHTRVGLLFRVVELSSIGSIIYLSSLKNTTITECNEHKDSGEGTC